MHEKPHRARRLESCAYSSTHVLAMIRRSCQVFLESYFSLSFDWDIINRVLIRGSSASISLDVSWVVLSIEVSSFYWGLMNFIFDSEIWKVMKFFLIVIICCFTFPSMSITFVVLFSGTFNFLFYSVSGKYLHSLLAEENSRFLRCPPLIVILFLNPCIIR